MRFSASLDVIELVALAVPASEFEPARREIQRVSEVVGDEAPEFRETAALALQFLPGFERTKRPVLPPTAGQKPAV